MDKRTFDAQLKNDAIENRFKIESDFIVFDKDSNLDYLIIPKFTLRNLLTKNPASSYTKLSKGFLLWLHRIRQEHGQPIYLNSGYRSPEYNLLIPGSAKDSWHTKGRAGDISSPSGSAALKATAEKLAFVGELGIYDNFIHIAPDVGENVRWDSRQKKSLSNYLDSDFKKNIAVGAILTLIGLFLLRRRK